MNPVVAVEESLSDVAAHLAANGIEVRKISNVGAAAATLKDCQALVITGLDRDLAGYAAIAAGIPVISARGQDPAAILRDVLARTRLQAAPGEAAQPADAPHSP